MRLSIPHTSLLMEGNRVEFGTEEGERLPTPLFWPGEFHGLDSPWDRKELDMTEQLSLSFYFTLSVSESSTK